MSFDLEYFTPTDAEREHHLLDTLAEDDSRDHEGELREPIHPDDIVYALQRRFDALLDRFSRGDRIDAGVLETIGIQIARTIGIVQQGR